MSPALRLSDIPTRTSLHQFLDLLGSLEHGQLDFKRQPAKLADLIPAYAMTDGGLIVLGIADDRSLHGCSLDQRTHDRITRAAHDVHVEVQLKEVLVDGHPVVVVAVPEVRGRIVTTTDGRLLRRFGSEVHPLVGDQLARFVREREEIPGEAEAVNATDADFDLQVIDQALQRDGKPPADPDDVRRALIDLDAAIPQAPPADAAITTAAVVLYAFDPRMFVPGAALQLVRRTGVGPAAGPTQEREEVSAPLPELVDRAMGFIQRHTLRYEVVLGRSRTVVPEYPEEVLREALLNALAHRDYSLKGSTVDVTIWDDRIEIRSPGPLPSPITLDNIREEHYSRNRRIMRGLKIMGLVEEYGEGVDRMFDLMDARLMDPPVIVATSTSVTVILHNRFLISVEEQAWLSMLGHLQLTRDERTALALARREGSITKRRIRQVVPAADTDAIFRGAVAKGLLVRTGTRGGARYELSDEVVMRAGSSGVEAQARKRQMLLDEMQRVGSLSTAEGAQLLDEEPALVRHLLNDLVSAGLARAQGQTRARRYHYVGH